MDVTGIHRVAQAVPAAAAAPADQGTQPRDLVRAVKALNQTEMFGQDNELEFQRDPQSRRMVARVVNRKTREIVSQVPPEYILRLAQDLKRPDYRNGRRGRSVLWSERQWDTARMMLTWKAGSFRPGLSN